MSITVRCSVCSTKLKATYDESTSKYIDDKIIKVAPCWNCINKAKLEMSEAIKSVMGRS